MESFTPPSLSSSMALFTIKATYRDETRKISFARSRKGLSSSSSLSSSASAQYPSITVRPKILTSTNGQHVHAHTDAPTSGSDGTGAHVNQHNGDSGLVSAPASGTTINSNPSATTADSTFASDAVVSASASGLGPDFPEYALVQEKIRKTFGLPSTTILSWWHVYFSPNDGDGDVKFRRHVCNEEEYKYAAEPLRDILFPKPCLVFQVLLSSDPRLSTATKYHTSISALLARQVLVQERMLIKSHVAHLSVMLAALVAKKEACAKDDETAIQFWDERWEEKMKELKEGEDEVRERDSELKRFDRERIINRAVIDKESHRNEEARKEVNRFVKVWKSSPRHYAVESECAVPASETKAHGEAEDEAEEDEEDEQEDEPIGLSKAAKERLEFDFEDYLANLQGGHSHGGKVPPPPSRTSNLPSPFPELDDIFPNVYPMSGRVPPAGARPPTSSAEASLRNMTDRLRDIVTAPNAGQAVTNEIKGMLDGFLVNLGSQFAEFEHGFKEKHTTISGALGQFQAGAKSKEDEIRGRSPAPSPPNVDSPSSAAARGAPTPPNMPGAFETAVNTHGLSTTTLVSENLSENTKAATVHGFVHVYKICDSCGEHPEGVCYKCDTCDDFDLCAKCIPQLAISGFHGENHKFEPLLHQDLARQLVKPATPTSHATANVTAKAKPAVHHLASCDICNAGIRGIRWKCLECPDWDCCTKCSTKLPHQHPGHNFVKIHNPDDLVLKRTEHKIRHTRVFCDGCDNSIVGVRYKCVHPNCLDFDLCEQCEARPAGTRHPMDHHFLKMRFPQFVENHSFFNNGGVAPARVALPTAPRVAIPNPPPVVTTTPHHDALPTAPRVAVPSPPRVAVPIAPRVLVATAPRGEGPKSSSPVPDHPHGYPWSGANHGRSAIFRRVQTYSPTPTPPFAPGYWGPPPMPQVQPPKVAQPLLAPSSDASRNRLFYPVPEPSAKAPHTSPIVSGSLLNQMTTAPAKTTSATTPSSSYSDSCVMDEERSGKLQEPIVPETPSVDKGKAAVDVKDEVHTEVKGDSEVGLDGQSIVEVEAETEEDDKIAVKVENPESKDLVKEQFDDDLEPYFQIDKELEGRTPKISTTGMNAQFEEDTTIPDGFCLPPNSEVMKIWKLSNTGSVTIPADCQLVHVAGERFGTNHTEPKLIGHDIKPGETFFVSLMNVRVPEKVGETVVGRWELVDKEGGQFGDVLYIEISVVAPEERSGLESSSVIIMPSSMGTTPSPSFHSLNASEVMSAAGDKTKSAIAPAVAQQESAEQVQPGTQQSPGPSSTAPSISSTDLTENMISESEFDEDSEFEMIGGESESDDF